MDKYYDNKAACTLLNKIIAERAVQCPEHLRLAEYSKEDGIAKLACIIEVNRPHCWKLATVQNDEGIQEELVLRMQGIICDRNLPPIKNPQMITLRECKFKRQSIMLTGFGAEKLQTFVEAIQAIFCLFEEKFDDNTIQKWNPTLFDGHVAIDMGNRFFTDRRNQSNQEMVPFKYSVDPDGILERAMGTDYVHLRENEVQYFKCIDKEKGGKKYQIIEPSKINKGDIVEVQVSFQVVPIKHKMFKPLIILRAITLLDTRPNKDALLHKIQESRPLKQSTSITTTLKRKVGYESEDLQEQQSKKTKTGDMDDEYEY